MILHSGILASGGAHDDRFLPVLAFALLLTVGLSLVLGRARIPVLPGYFACGMLLAASGAADLAPGSPATRLLEQMGGVGIILLMFTIGVECSFAELSHLRRTGLRAGLVQLVFTAVAALPFLVWAGLSGTGLVISAFLVALSSTAVGLKLFQDMGMANHPGARLTLGIALLQDFAVIFLLVLLPGLSGGMDLEKAAGLTGALIIKGVVFLAVAGLLSRYGIPRILRVVSLRRSNELFTLTVLALCAGIASLGNALGLNSALGAFAAGLAVSGSVYSHRILGDATTFRDFFLTIFFVSIGAFVDFRFFAAHWVTLLAAAAGILIMKATVLAVAGRLSGVPLRGSILAGIALSGIGEFSIVAADQALAVGVLPANVRQVLLIEVVLTLGLSPLLMRVALPWTKKWEGARGSKPKKGDTPGMKRSIKEMSGHAILCGYGTVGQMVHQALLRLDIPVIILELNAETVRRLIKEGHAVLFADLSQGDTLELAGVERARVIAITFPHVDLARATITVARERNPDIAVLCRARFPSEVATLREVARGGVVHDEREAGLQMLRLCLSAYDRDPEEVDLIAAQAEATEVEISPAEGKMP